MAEDSVKNSYCFYSVLLWSVTNSDARCYGKRSRSFQPPHTTSLSSEPSESVLWWLNDVAEPRARPGCFPHPSSISECLLMALDGLMPPPEAPASLGSLSPWALLAPPAMMSPRVHSRGDRNPQPVPAPRWIWSPRSVVCCLSPMHADETTYQLLGHLRVYFIFACWCWRIWLHMSQVVTLTKRCHVRNKSRMQVKQANPGYGCKVHTWGEKTSVSSLLKDIGGTCQVAASWYKIHRTLKLGSTLI